MAWTKALTEMQERQLIVDYMDGYRVVDLIERYSVSKSTVERILSDYSAPRKDGSRKRRKQLREQAKGRKLKPCGTNAAYARHKKSGQYPCTPCLEAHARQQKEWSDGKRQTLGKR